MLGKSTQCITFRGSTIWEDKVTIGCTFQNDCHILIYFTIDISSASARVIMQGLVMFI